MSITFYTDSFTPRSFVSHNTSVRPEKLPQIDLLPKIKDKLLIIPEMAPVFSAKDDELIQNLGIMIRILDGHGYESDSGAYGHRGYSENVMFALIGAAVDIPRKVCKHLSTPGPKLYFFRMETKKNTEAEYVEDLKNGDFSKSKGEVEASLLDYLEWFDYCPIGNLESGLMKIECDHSKDDKNVLRCIVKLGKLLSRLRGSAQTWETGDTQGSDYAYSTPIIETPRRAITSLRNLATGHALIHGQTNISMNDIPLIIKTVLSTAPIERVMIFDLLLNSKGTLTSSQIMEFLGVSRPTALRTMTDLKVLGLVEIKKETESDGNSPVIINLKQEFKWFLSNEFKELREGFIAEKHDEKEGCKEKTPPPALKEYDDVDKEFDFDLLKDIFWEEFAKIEQKEKMGKLAGYKLIGGIKLKNALMKNPVAKSMKIYDEVVDKLINKLLKEGTLVERRKGQYYRSNDTPTTASDNVAASG